MSYVMPNQTSPSVPNARTPTRIVVVVDIDNFRNSQKTISTAPVKYACFLSAKLNELKVYEVELGLGQSMIVTNVCEIADKIEVAMSSSNQFPDIETVINSLDPSISHCTQLILLSAHVTARKLHLDFHSYDTHPLVIDLGKNIHNKQLAYYQIINGNTNDCQLSLEKISDILIRAIVLPEKEHANRRRANFKFDASVKQSLKSKSARETLFFDVDRVTDEADVYSNAVKRVLRLFDVTYAKDQYFAKTLLVQLSPTHSRQVSYVILKGNGSTAPGGYGRIVFNTTNMDFRVTSNQDQLLESLMWLCVDLQVKLRADQSPAKVQEELAVLAQKIYKKTKRTEDTWLINGQQFFQQPQNHSPVTAPALQNDFEEIFTAGGNQTFTDAPACLASGAPIENTGVSMDESTREVRGQQLPEAPGALVPGNQSGVQFQCPRRPNDGVEGRAILLRANHFAVRIPGGIIQHYQVDVSPDKSSLRVNREVINCMIHSFSKYFNNCRPVYDGKRNMYTRDLLPIERVQKVFDVMLPGDSAIERQFSVSLKWLGQVSLSVLEDAMEGIEQQVPFEAIDDSANAFHRSMPVIEFIAEVLELPVQALAERRALSDAQRVKLTNEIRGLKIEITHSGQMREDHRAWKVTRRPAQTQTFPLQLETGQTIECTVAKYFYDKYRIQLKYPHLPCLVVGQQFYLPPEVCNIVPGQRCIKKLTDVQTSNSLCLSGDLQYMPGMMGTSVVQNGPTSYHQNGPQPRSLAPEQRGQPLCATQTDPLDAVKSTLHLHPTLYSIIVVATDETTTKKNLAATIYDILAQCYRTSERKPTSIIISRSGKSNNNGKEMEAVDDACVTWDKDYQPRIVMMDSEEGRFILEMESNDESEEPSEFHIHFRYNDGILNTNVLPHYLLVWDCAQSLPLDD